MAKTSSEVVIGANGSVYVAPLDATLPTDVGTALGAEWAELGYTSADGVTLTDGKEIFDVDAWQSFYPLRSGVQSRNFTASFVLRQWNESTVSLAFGGGSVEDIGGGEYQYHPPGPEEIDERALVIEWQDNDKNYRVLLSKGLVTDDVETSVARTAAADLPITFALRPTGTEDDPWTLFTDDPAFAS